MSTEPFDLARLLARELDAPSAPSVLEFGRSVANGAYRPALLRAGWRHTGADLEPGPNVERVIDDPYRLPFGDGAFDAIVVSGLLERVAFFWLTWKELARILKPRGVVVLEGAPETPEDSWRLTSASVRALAELGQLEILESQPSDGMPARRAAVLRKATPPATAEPPGPPSPVGPKPALSPLVRDAAYAGRLGLTLAEWLIYHQEEIVFEQATWMGVRVLKNPLDCWIYQEILFEVKPERVVEIGSLAGGSTLFFCHMLDLIGRGKVVSVERDRAYFQARHPRIVEVTGDCSDPGVRAQVTKQCAGRRTLVVHDADHSAEAVLRDLRSYADLVSPGSYFIVEDGIVELFHSSASTRLGWSRPGPLTAVREFLAEDDRFVADWRRERYVATYSPNGFLKRVK